MRARENRGGWRYRKTGMVWNMATDMEYGKQESERELAIMWEELVVYIMATNYNQLLELEYIYSFIIQLSNISQQYVSA